MCNKKQSVQLAKVLQELKDKLLDISKRNPLINFAHSERGKNYIRIVDEIPDLIITKINANHMSFKPLPDIEKEPEDEKTLEFQSLFQASLEEDEEYLLKLWEIEDKIRIFEKEKTFDDDFVALARSVYITNDKRFEVKNEINLLFNTSLREIKDYQEY